MKQSPLEQNAQDPVRDGCAGVTDCGGDPFASRRTLSGRMAVGLRRILPALRKLGVAGFLFFLVKGLAWLIVPALLVRAASG